MVQLRPGEMLIDTRCGAMVGFVNDTGVSEALRRFGEYGLYEAAIYHRLLGTAGSFLDIGANIGALSVAVSSLAPQRRVVAFEPQLPYFGAALVNLRRFPNASVYPLALTDRDGLVDVPEIQPDRRGNYGAIDLAKAEVADRRYPVAGTTLDRFLRHQDIVPGLLKIDVEGMESLVLRGAVETLRDASPIVSVEADRREQGGRTVDLLVSCGYRVFLIFFRAISKQNPKHDPTDVHCRNLHVHVIGFGAAIPDWWLQGFAGNELRDADGFLTRFDRRFP